jgi:hypothetical protein
VAADLAAGEVDAALRLYGEEALHYQVEAQPQPHPSSEMFTCNFIPENLGRWSRIFRQPKNKRRHAAIIASRTIKRYRGESNL